MSGFRKYFEQAFSDYFESRPDDYKTWNVTSNCYLPRGGGGVDCFSRLIDHGFIVDQAALYATLAGASSDLSGHEIAIVSRTYCADDEIDNPPDGLKCVRLPDRFLGGDVESSTVIMTVIAGDTPAALAFLNCCSALPARLLGVTLSREMIDMGYRVCIDPIEHVNFGVRFLITNSADTELAIKFMTALADSPPSKELCESLQRALSEFSLSVNSDPDLDE